MCGCGRSLRTMGRASRDTVPAVARLSPRHALSAPEAALFVGINENMFRELVEEGVMPRPRMIRSRVLWDADELVLAFKSLPRQGEEPESVIRGWDDVVSPPSRKTTR